MPDRESAEGQETGGAPAGFLALVLIAAAAGAAAALLLGPERRIRARSRGQRTVAAAGFLVGAGLTALLTPESGPATRKSLGSGLNRLKVGAIDHIERLRLSKTPASPESPQ